MKITFIQTGGTIDKDYPKTIRGYNFEITQPAVVRILQKINLNFEYKIIELLKKDSNDLTEQDRILIKQTCEKLESDKIIITHGTDTMIETGKFLKDINDKVIILVGAFKPEKFYDSDAAFNIGVAIGAINVLKNGVFIAMSGRIYPIDKCKRNLEDGKFIEV